MRNQTTQLETASFIQRHKMALLSLLMGTAFGFIMSRAGATTYDFHIKLFLFEDLQLLQVVIGAVTVGILGVLLLKKFQVNSLSTGLPIEYTQKPYQKTLIVGAILFGMGWAITASCPGTVPAMLGEGKIGALFVFIGILLGTYLQGLTQK